MNAKKIYWRVCAGFFCLASLAWLSTWYVDYSINVSRSLPGTFYLIFKGAAFERGDLVAFRWNGGGNYAHGVTFIKVAKGMPGDVVSAQGRNFSVNGQFVATAKERSLKGVPLQAAQPGVVAPGEYFVSTPSADSLDSRYAITGNIKQRQILGRAYEVF